MAKNEEVSREWRKVWIRALHNMPGKRIVTFTPWEPLRKGTVTIPDFIKGRAKKLMMENEGQFYQRTAYFTCWNQIAVLRIMMGEIMEPHKGRAMRSEIKRGITWGVRPRDPKRRKRLLLLGTPRGRELAWKYLRSVGKDHLFINPEDAGEQNAKSRKARS